MISECNSTNEHVAFVSAVKSLMEQTTTELEMVLKWARDCGMWFVGLGFLGSKYCIPESGIQPGFDFLPNWVVLLFMQQNASSYFSRQLVLYNYSNGNYLLNVFDLGEKGKS